MRSPVVSVIVPVYNAKNRLEIAINSLLNQKNIELEIVVVDDASKDGSLSIIEKLASTNKNIKAIKFDENKGVYQARLTGINAASAPWIGFLDADDVATEFMFEKMHAIATSQDVDMVLCGSYRVSTDGKILKKRTSFERNQRINQDIFGRFCHLEFGDGALWNKLYRADILKSLPLDKMPWRQKINEDMITNIGAFKKAKSIYLMKDMLHHYIVNSYSVTANNNKYSAYVETFRAYAAALHIYQHMDNETILHVTGLYRKQLDSHPCRVDDLETLDINYTEHLTEASNRIMSIYPNGLSLLCSRPTDITNLPIKLLAKSLLKRISLRLNGSL